MLTLNALLPLLILRGASVASLPSTYETTYVPLIPLESKENAVPGTYIVKLKSGTNQAIMTMSIASRKPKYIYNGPGFLGFAGRLNDTELNALRRHPEVELIEEDAAVTTDMFITQPHPPWGLARLSSRTGNATEYRYHESAGAGTCIYVLDTGVDASNSEFNGRVIPGTNIVGGSDADDNGHGTSVAGVVGSLTYGVAKRTKIIPVKVLNSNGSGTTAGVIAGMNWIAADAAERSSDCPRGLAAVVALGGGRSSAINTAANGMVDAGVFVAAAAGGSNGDVSFTSPASEPTVCTTGATDNSDTRSSFSNYGEGVDLFSPGVDIQTTWLAGGTETLSGTSYSAAYVAGLGAYLLGLGGNLTGTGLCEYMQRIATRDVLGNIPAGTKNLLAYNGFGL